MNRDIQSLAELNGEVALNSDRVSLIKEIVRMEEESGLTLGTQRTIGVKGEFTNLVREGATLEATTEWRNTGNTTVDGLQVEAIENKMLAQEQFSQGKQTESGRFVDGEWVAEAAESRHREGGGDGQGQCAGSERRNPWCFDRDIRGVWG